MRVIWDSLFERAVMWILAPRQTHIIRGADLFERNH
jgi:hypothetical protein